MADDAKTGADNMTDGSEFLFKGNREATEALGSESSTEAESPPKEQGEEAPVEQVEERPWWQELGFTDESKAIDSARHAQQKITQQAQELSELNRKYAYERGYWEGQQPRVEEPKSQPLTDEQITELFDSDPVTLIRHIREETKREIFDSPQFKEAMEASKDYRVNSMVGGLTRRNADFAEYEQDIVQELGNIAQEQGPEAAMRYAQDPYILELMYKSKKAEKTSTLNGQTTEEAKKAAEAAKARANKFANIGGGPNLRPQTPASTGKEGGDKTQTVKTDVGEIPADDLSFVTNVHERLRLGR